MPRLLSNLSIVSASLVSASLVSLALGALAACSGPAELPAESFDLAMAPTADLGQPTATPGCRPGAVIHLQLPLAELRSTTPLPIEVMVADSASATAPHPVKVTLEKPDGTLIATLLDTAAPLGALPVPFTPSTRKDLPTGALRLRAEVGCPAAAPGEPARATATLYLLRLGATQLVVQDGEGGGRVPLMYHALDHLDANYFPIPETMAASSVALPPGEAELDQPDGKPRPFPAEPWADLATPPLDASGMVSQTGYTIPVSLKLGTRPELVFTIGKTAQGRAAVQPTGLGADGLPPIRLVVEGTAGSDTALVTEGGTARVQLATSPVPTIARVDQSLAWHFEFKDSGGSYVPIPGAEQHTTLRFYGVLGNDQGTAAPDLPWVAVVDEVTTRIAGKATDAPGARAVLVQYVYEEMGLTYDRKSGASHYSKYAGGGWTSASFSLAAFLTRARGKIVNCTDCASILSTYANMIGAKLHYAIIGWNFKLNPILGIGAMSFGSPFDSGRFSFSYHAVTTPDEALTIDDATLAVDGDSDPTAAPQTRRLVQDLTGEDYLTRLSSTFGTGTPVYQYNDQLTHAR